jgi:hypothetical protein
MNAADLFMALTFTFALTSLGVTTIVVLTLVLVGGL